MSKRHKAKKTYHGGSYPSYRKEPKEAFQLGKTKRPVWGGPFSKMQYQDWSVLICCNGLSPSPIVYASPQAMQLMPKLQIQPTCPYIRLDWADLRTPEIRFDFWSSLVAGLQKIGRPGPIGVCCMGGTGRTGTALAIIAQLSGAVPDGQCPLAFIRANYAHDAVETEEQGKYITSITGVPLLTPVEKLHYYSDHGSHANLTTDLKCVHGKPMHMFCSECLTKSGTISNYQRTGV